MYYTNNNHQDRYCLLYYVVDNIVVYPPPYTLAHQIIPYCLRSSENIADILNINNTIDPSYNFTELRDNNITSQQLLDWSASIDLAEEYQFFLNNISGTLLSAEKDLVFHNCTYPWFGPYCRFTFNISSKESLNEIVKLNFNTKRMVFGESKATCYEHINCGRSWLCLDWREICDRKIDCVDGSDELNCWKLEMNECANDEYRCYNGQCIPSDFFHDGQFNPDCLDRTDEPTSQYTNCPADPAFRCEEQTCQPGKEEFSCGDGQCTSDMAFTCRNNRNGHFGFIRTDMYLPTMTCLMQHKSQLHINEPNHNDWYKELCKKINCSENNCSLLYELFSGPVLFGHVYFIFKKEKKSSNFYTVSVPDFICYDETRCREYLPGVFYLKNSTCRFFSNSEVGETHTSLMQLAIDVRDQFRTCLEGPRDIQNCNHSTMYQCTNSTKCISKHRLVDGIQDCPFNDDELFNQSCSLSDAHWRFQCSTSNKIKCFVKLALLDGKSDCEDGEDEREQLTEYEYRTHISFQMICNGIEELLPILIDGQNETDETHCEPWECNNIYTRCDGFWACKNGADEINCPSSICPGLEHACIFPNDTFKLSCLPMDQAGDGFVDCLGATDEPNYCQDHSFDYVANRFRCWNNTDCLLYRYLCDQSKQCLFGDDEEFCNSQASATYATCFRHPSRRTDVENFLCNFVNIIERSLESFFFALRNMTNYPLQIMTGSMSTAFSEIPYQLIENDPLIDVYYKGAWLCNRGLPIYIRTSAQKSKLFCLCPPSYYGDRCQYQNQRVSLSLQIRATSDWHNEFIFLVMLIDDKKNIESHDHIEYLSVRDCGIKFNINLIFSTRPKNSSKHYTVRIHAFNRITSSYRSTWIYPIQFSFLPVYRLSILLTLPYSSAEVLQRCTPSCVNGQCFSYINDQNSVFCLCKSGWSGHLCNIKYTCDCANNSLCIDKTICLCPVGQFGPRCYLHQPSCPLDWCLNGGDCIFGDERYSSERLEKRKCVCSKEYFGDRCEYRQTQIHVSFYHELDIPQSLLFHFISVRLYANPIRTSTMKKIAFDQNSLILYTSITFNIAFTEMFGNFYLIILQEKDIVSANITTEIIPSHRCSSVDELLSQTFGNQHLLKRIKYYQLPCQKQLDLLCFYDDIHLCFCDFNRRSNCFEFNHNMTYDCYGQNVCENGGRCFQNDPKCPTSSTCVCLECYYGSRCQFSVKGSTLSLDAILGYGIHPHTPVHQQPFIVKFTISLTTTIFVLGLLSNFFSFVTFNSKKTCDVGCGLYLKTSSIVAMITISTLTIKFWLFLASQMGSINNRSVIHIQCISIDFLLRCFVSYGDWLSACVAIERAVNVSTGLTFNKQKSKLVAKWIILVIFFCTTCTYIHDPVNRYLIDDNEEHRTWCVTKYSASIRTLDWIMNILHFSFPFGMNCFSALVVITATARTRSKAQKNHSYKQHLCTQFRQHKHLLVSPFILILLALPRLIISFLSGCMKSARNPWLYLTGYFVSFIPTTMTFIVFVAPSEVYTKEFKNSMKRFWPN